MHPVEVFLFQKKKKNYRNQVTVRGVRVFPVGHVFEQKNKKLS